MRRSMRRPEPPKRQPTNLNSLTLIEFSALQPWFNPLFWVWMCEPRAQRRSLAQWDDLYRKFSRRAATASANPGQFRSTT